MKRLIAIPAMILFTASAAFSQVSHTQALHDRSIAKAELREVRKEDRDIRKEDRKIEISYQAKQNFYKDFPGASNIGYMKGKDFDEIVFTLDDQVKKAYYDMDANLVGTTQQVAFGELPAKARKEIANHYKSYTVDNVILFDDNEADETDMVLYGNRFEDRDNYFIEMVKEGKRIVLQSTPSGDVSFFAEVK
ncbi:MAG TPA: hypothetical protein VF476_18305 [Chitinophagaceae bacterium]